MKIDPIVAGEIIVDNQRFESADILQGTHDEIAQRVSPYGLRALNFCRLWLSGAREFVVQTSGSTGAPKKIALTRAQMAASARATGKALGLTASDRALICLSIDHIAGIMMLTRTMELGLRSVVIPPAAQPLSETSRAAEFDFVALVPMQVRAILDAGDSYISALNGMKAILVGGASVADDLHEELQRISAPVYGAYGLTEAASHIALRRLNGLQAGDWFRPMEGVELSVDKRNCLAIRAPSTNGIQLQTNDIVDLRPDGTFLIVGRADNVINSGGYKVQAEKVERAIGSVLRSDKSAGVAARRFFVTGIADDRLGAEVVCVLEGEPLTPATEQILRDRMQSLGTLHRYELPRRFLYTRRFIETQTGKIDRRANLARISE